MISVDTNILVHANNADAEPHARAFEFVRELGARDDVVICELVLVELYILLRNPAVFARPLTSTQAVDVCDVYRTNPLWRLVEYAPVMSTVWSTVRRKGFARRRIIDLRLALTLQHHGVNEFATDNVRDFRGLGFQRVWSPLN